MVCSVNLFFGNNYLPPPSPNISKVLLLWRLKPLKYIKKRHKRFFISSLDKSVMHPLFCLVINLCSLSLSNTNRMPQWQVQENTCAIRKASWKVAPNSRLQRFPRYYPTLTILNIFPTATLRLLKHSLTLRRLKDRIKLGKCWCSC